MLLRSSDIFRGLSGALLREATQGIEWRHLLGGDVLFRKGENGDALYVVINGRLRVIEEDAEGRTTVLREIGRRGHVGELALLTDEPRSATVRAVRDSLLARFSRESFQRLLIRHPAAILPLTRALAAFIRTAHVAPRADAAASTIALIPLHRGVPIAQLAERLCDTLAGYGPTVRIDLPLVENCVPGGIGNGAGAHPNHGALSAWLDELEVTHRFVVYEGDCASTAWMRQCIREADRVVFVAAAGGNVREAAHTIARLSRSAPGGAREELVLLHPDGALPSGTAAWLRLRQFDAHHHVRLRDARDVQRLVRCFTGTSIGVVLSGGAAKGFAHIGVLRALDEAGIPVDHIGGTSMGAVIAAQYAAGMTPAEMVEVNRLWRVHNPLRDVTVPVIALISGTSGLRLLEAMFDDRRIEDLWIDYFCVSANLTRSQPVVHKEGPLRQWVRASISIPGIAPPLRIASGDLLVDGAVLNNMPADVMRARGAGRVIAVDVTPPEALPTDDYIDQPSTWQMLQLLRSGILPFGTPLKSPTIFTILYRTVLAASRSLSERLKTEVDLYIAPAVAGVGFFDWKNVEHIAEIGYQEARHRLKDWTDAETNGRAPSAIRHRRSRSASGAGRPTSRTRSTARRSVR